MRKTWISALKWAGRGWIVVGSVLLLSAGPLYRQILPATAGVSLQLGRPGADIISTFTLVGHTESGRKKWEVQGQTADLLTDTVNLSPVSAKSFGKVEVHLTADRGEFHKVTQDVHLRGHVVAVTSDGARLVTDSLDWVQQTETGTTRDPVTVTRPGMKATGLGGVGRPKLKKVRLDRQVTVTLEGQGGPTVITCDGPMEVDYGRNRARFLRNVLARDSKGFVEADRLDATLDSVTSRMDKATFWGHVEIHHGSEVAHANRAEYWQLRGQVRLTGHPRLVMFTDGEPFLE
ncbi:MAG: LPS export ABC transporter periplasmic protein LptC [Candidatus Omnitrophica bacterium]|nr:LPS export ABC transporter periplasmic protein LptC [Candidatus Omnitrophota bacterium]